MFHPLSRRSWVAFILIAEILISPFSSRIVSAATPPTPPGFLTGGLFAQYFKNAVDNPCPALYYIRGFKSVPATDYMKPDCVLGQNIDKWDLSGNAGTTAVNFLGTTDNQALRFKTNGVQNMILDTAGNLGIGTNNAGAKLQVFGGPAMAAGYNRVLSLYSDHPTLQFKGRSDTNNSAFIGYDAESISEALRFWVRGTTDDVGNALVAMSIGSNGNIGIGTTVPGVKLDVAGSIRQTNGVIYLDNTSAGSQHSLFNYVNPGQPNNGDFYLGAGRDANRSKNNIYLYNLSCSTDLDNGPVGPNDCYVPNIFLYGEKVNAPGKFSIGGTTLPDAQLTINQPGNGWADGIRLRSPVVGSSIWDILNGGATSPGFFTIAPDQDYSRSFTIQASNGNVGIGTTTPTSKLDIMSSYSDASLNADAPATANFRTAGHVQLAISTQLAAPYTTSIQAKHTTANGSAYPIALNPLGGNVGIGINNPGAKLDVEGRFRVQYGTPIYGVGITAVGPGGGGWARRYGFTTQDGLSRLGGFGGLGTDNALSSLWIGKDHNDYVASFNPSTYETSLSGGLTFNQVNPYITASSYFIAPGGAYFNGGPVYANAAIWARGGIRNDQATYLTLLGGTSGDTYIPGKLGIGTTTPSVALEVAGTVKATAFQSTSGTPAAGKVLTATDNLGNATWQNIAASVESDPKIGANALNYLAKWNGAALVTSSVFDNGNIGIGTATPGAKLDVNGTINSSSDITADNLFRVNNATYGAYLTSWGIGNNNTTPDKNIYLEPRAGAYLVIAPVEGGDNLTTSIAGDATISKNLSVSQALQARIFYDADDTAYYVDPRSNSILNTLRLTGGSPGAGKFLTSDAIGNASWTGISVSSGMPGGIMGQTLYHNGANWVATSSIFNSGGNIGIGTATPGAKLDVNGTINSSSDITADNLFRVNNATYGAYLTSWGIGNNNTTPDKNIYLEPRAGAYLVIAPVEGGDNLTTSIAGDATISKNLSVGAALQARTFYDADNTNYYVDPGSTSILNSLRITGGSPGVGRFLTSDAIGNASWTGISVSSGMPGGILGQTLYHNGASWVATSSIFNSGGNIGIGTTTPGAKFDVTSNTAEVAQFTSTSNHGYISLMAGGENRGYMSTSASGNLSIMNPKLNGKLSLGTEGTAPFTIDGGMVGINTTSPTASFDIAGTMRLRNGAGDGKVLVSDVNGNATWRDPSSTTTGGGGDKYSSLTGTIEIIPRLPAGGSPMFWTDLVQRYTPLNIACNGGKFKLTVTERESGDWPALNTEYIFDGGINNKEFNKEYYVWQSGNGNHLDINVGGYISDRKAFVDGVSVMWWDGSPQGGGVQLEAACIGTCSLGYTGDSCQIPPCEIIYLNSIAVQGGNVQVLPTNSKNSVLYRVGDYYGGFYALMCDTASTNVDVTSYISQHMNYMNMWSLYPNIGQDFEWYGWHLIANPNNIRLIVPAYVPPPPYPECTSACS